MTQQWDRLAELARARRKVLRLRQIDVAERADVDVTTVRNIEGMRKYTELPLKIGQVEDALGWAQGSAERILAGGDPELAEDGQPRLLDSTTWWAQQPASVRATLTEGEVLGQDVIEFPVSGFNMVIIANRGEYTDQDDDGVHLRKQTRKWRLLQERMREIAIEIDQEDAS